MKQPVLKTTVFSDAHRDLMVKHSKALTEAVVSSSVKEVSIKPIEMIQIPKKVKPYQKLKESNIAFGSDVRETFIAKTAEIVFESFWLDSAIKEKHKEAYYHVMTLIRDRMIIKENKGGSNRFVIMMKNQ